MKILSKRQTVQNIRYSHHFDYIGKSGHGFSFDCDKDGEVFALQDAGRANYMACLAGTNGTVDVGIVEYASRYHAPAVGQCEICEKEVSLSSFTNTCECGADYNMSGHLLADRSQWGEETGESAEEILLADSDAYDAADEDDRFYLRGD